MLNYILADYRRILTRVPRLVFLALYEACIVISVILAWRKGGEQFSSVDLMDTISLWLFGLGYVLLGVSALINVFGDDFKCKTMQVAIGIGVTRLRVVVSKQIQAALIVITDLLVTLLVVAILSLVTGARFVPEQLSSIMVECIAIVVKASCWISIVSILVFKLQSMLLPMVAFLVLSAGVTDPLVRLITRHGPDILQRMHLENYTPDHLLSLFKTGMMLGKLDVGAAIGVAVYIAAGIFFTHLVFRKQELDF